MSAGVFIGIGTNLGDREANCVEALFRISRFAGIEKVSPLYKTEPVGVEGSQPFFINAVLMIGQAPPPEELLHELRKVEKEMGRTGKGKNRPRVIDLDILFHHDTVMENEEIKIPHPQAHTRRFVLEPMRQIAPGFRHPAAGKTVEEILKTLDDNGYVELWKSRFFPFCREPRGGNF